MNLRIFLFISILAGSFLYTSLGSASVIYDPADTILMTGSTTDVRFDVAGIIFDEGTSAQGPELDSNTMKFHGSFYMTGIGWGLMQTGTYQVGLDCGTSPDFSALPSICHLTGSGWSEAIGEIGFSGAEFISSNGTLSGSLSTLFGKLNLNGVSLPLLPANFLNSIDNSVAHHNYTLTVSGAIGFGDGSWSLAVEPQKAVESRNFAGVNGVFSSIDLSLADTYTFIVTDPNGSTTESSVNILPGELSLSLAPGSYFIELFCTNHPDKCPDGASLSATQLVKTGNNLVGDGKSFYTFRLRSRDKYGNTINVGKVNIHYISNIKSVQIEPTEITSYPTEYIGSLPGDAIIHSGEVLLTDLALGTSNSVDIPLVGQDIVYGIASIAPTDAQNIIKLDSINYITSTGQTLSINGLDKTPLTFSPWYTATTSSVQSDIHVGEDNQFSVALTSNSPRVDVPAEVYTFLMIGDGLFGAFRDFTSSDATIDCQAYPQDPPTSGMCSWPLYRGFITPSVVKSTSSTSFHFTGSYAPMTRYPITEKVRSENMIHYPEFDTYGSPINVLYREGSEVDFGDSLYQDSNVKILGISNAKGEYGDLFFEGNGKAKFFDTLRKKVTLLSRNRNIYNDVDYTVITGDYTLTGGSFDSKRSIIVLGGNVTITENIDPKDTPLALIALTDIEGNGGVIHIDPNVTDINLSLITDRHILSSGDHQLYVHGSLISSNTLGDTLARICPYYITTTCDVAEAAKYDFENMRAEFSKLTVTTGKTSSSSRAIGYPHTSFIVEQDARVVSNPPPGL